MKPHSLIIDDFLTTFDELRAYADEAVYQDIENPVDGVSYPGICAYVPRPCQTEIVGNLSAVMGAEVIPHRIFMRLSKADVPVPHQAHTDATMGQFSLMLYMNRAEHCKGGTSLVRHKQTGMCRNPRNEQELSYWKRDCNSPDEWDILNLCRMQPNRAFIFDATLFHRAEPIGGFGDDAKNGRLVLTCFFSIQ